jgi:sarcosine oxidase, subunit beta
MGEHYRVAIVGGGVSGLSCLYHLAERDVTDCLLLEQGGLASGSSGRSAAFIETQYLDQERIRLCAWSLDLYERFGRENGLRFEQIGKLLLAYTADALDAFERSIVYQRGLGRTESRILDACEVGARAGALRLDGIVAALWGPRDGYTDAAQLCEIYANAANAKGSRTLISTLVGAVRRRPSGGFLLETDRGSFTCDILINSSGAWAAHLGARLGLHIPVAGYRRQVGVYETASTLGETPIVVVPPSSEASWTLYFRQDGPGRLLAGLHSEQGDEPVDDPQAYRRDGDPEFKEDVAGLLLAKLQPGVRLRTVGGWSGLYPLTPDGEMILGEVQAVPGFYNAVGLGGNGIQLSGAIGRIVSELIVDGHSSLAPSLDRYLLERFDGGVSSTLTSAG